MTGIVSCAAPFTPTPHPDAAAFGFKTLTFFDDFNSSSTIDLSNTGAPGFNWYLQNAWPHATSQGGGWSGLFTAPVTTAGDVTVANSILSLAGGGGASNGLMLNSACPNGTGFVGNVFGGGFYLEAKIATGTQTLLWAMPIEFFTGSVNAAVEFDMFEYNTGAIDMFVHEWNFSGGSVTNDSSDEGFGGGPNFPMTVYTDFHTYGWLWVPASKNGGTTGFFQRYVNGVNMGSGWRDSYTTTGLASPGLTPNNSNGSLSEIDAQHQMLMLWCGAGTAKYDYVAVWQ